MPNRTAALVGLEARLCHPFRDVALLETALTHRSFANEHGLTVNYERLEFLGDAVLGLCAAEWLFERHPAGAEGDLSRLKSYLVSATALASYAEEIDLGALLLLGVGEERSGGRVKGSLLADALEALFGAVFLDGGMAAARRAIEPMLLWAMAVRERLSKGDAKTRLQELAQARGWALPAYRHVAAAGPDHDKLFTVECWVAGRPLGIAAARSKKLAEQEAATEALTSLAAAGEA